MKNLRKILSGIIVFMMLLAVMLPVGAAETGTITVTNAFQGQTYRIYRMFDLDTYDTTAGNYSYKITDAWKNFVLNDDTGKTYFELDNSETYVTAKEGANAHAASIAEAAHQYAINNSIAVTAEKKTATGESTVVFENLPLGYYLLDTTTGALCSLTTTDNTAEVIDKNSEPTVIKEVLVDADHDSVKDAGETYAKENDANIGDTVYFKTEITALPGAQNYVLHDIMDTSLTFNTDSIKVYTLASGSETLLTEGADKDYTVELDTKSASDVAASQVRNCTFEIHFTKDYLDAITATTTIYVEYSAVLNESAKIYPNHNINETFLDYGEENRTEISFTETDTYFFEVVKTDKDAKVLDGAKFILYPTATGTDPIELYLEDTHEYRVATDAEITAGDRIVTETNFSHFRIEGLAAGTYYLEETEAPKGYNKLTERVKVTITANENPSAVKWAEGFDHSQWESGGVRVINEAGTLLPETGGIGTTIFYAIGGILVAGALILLITKKRMGSEQ